MHIAAHNSSADRHACQHSHLLQGRSAQQASTPHAIVVLKRVQAHCMHNAFLRKCPACRTTDEVTTTTTTHTCRIHDLVAAQQDGRKQESHGKRHSAHQAKTSVKCKQPMWCHFAQIGFAQIGTANTNPYLKTPCITWNGHQTQAQGL